MEVGDPGMLGNPLVHINILCYRDHVYKIGTQMTAIFSPKYWTIGKILP